MKAVTLDPKLHKLLNWAASTNYSHKIIVGDFNHPGISWTPDPELPEGVSPESPAHKFVECIRDTYLLQHITEPTRYRDGQRSTLDDLLFTNEQEMVEQLQIRDPVGASDHAGISFKMKFAPQAQTGHGITRNYHKANFEEMRNAVNLDWAQMFQGKSVQEMADKLQEVIHNAVEQYVPKVDHSKGTRKKPLWMNQNAIRKVKRKRHAWIRFLNTKDNSDYQAYVRVRNEATHATRKARREFEALLAKEVKGNHKVFWNYVNRCRKTRKGIVDLRSDTGELVSNDKDKADVLNHQYAKVFTQEDRSSLPKLREKSLESELSITISTERVHAKLKALKVDKSPGPDQLHPRVLQELADQLSVPITLLFTRSITTGEVPRQWKVATVTPIYKRGDRADPANYRPVSLTSILCKVLERIICEEVLEHFKVNNLLCNQQHGFINGKSTVTNLLEALDVWTEALSHNLPVDVVFLDFAKAFDTVPHERLLAKIHNLGIKNNILKWIRNFLMGRRQRVKVNGALSDWIDVTSGVPQGSVLGPILFSTFVCDIPELLHCFVSMFADDTKIYEIVHEQGNQHSDLQVAINTLQEWAKTM